MKLPVGTNGKIIVLDFETTGLSPDMGDRATEVAAVMIEGGCIVDRFQSLMNAGVRIPAFVEEFTGITNKMIQKAPPAGRVMESLVRFVKSCPVIAHNASFDRKFFDAELSRIRRTRQQEFICSMRLARRIFPDAPGHSLETVARYAGVEQGGTYHRALADATTTARLWIKMVDWLKTTYSLSEVPLSLMVQLQSVPKSQSRRFLSNCANEFCV